MKVVDTWPNLIHRWLWPATCVLCLRQANATLDLCSACREELPESRNACRTCAQPLAEQAAADLLCGACLRRPPLFDSSTVAFRYAYPIDHLIHAFKYRNDVACGRVLGELLARHLKAHHHESLPQVMIPIPLGEQRYRQRGFNQAIELAIQLEKVLHVPLRTDAVERVRETREQAELNRKDRRKNLRGAFRVNAAISQRHVAIIDDVMTTGSTAHEMAKVLRRAGVERIELWAVARA